MYPNLIAFHLSLSSADKTEFLDKFNQKFYFLAFLLSFTFFHSLSLSFTFFHFLSLFEMSHFAFAIANFITSRISTHFNGLEPTMMIALNSGIHEVLSAFSNQFLIVIVMSSLVSRYVSKIFPFVSNFFSKSSEIVHDIDIEDPVAINNIGNYMHSKPEIFRGVRYYRGEDRETSLRAGIDIKFDDDGTRGTIKTSQQEVERLENDKKSIVTVFCLTLAITPNEKFKTARAYYIYMDDCAVEIRNKDTSICLTYAKQINNKEWFTQDYHVGTKSDHAIQSMKFIDSFFHQEKDWIWRYCMTVDRNPSVFYNAGQAPYGNFLLYGPPGTGKSTLVYRLGRALGRHIVSVDLSCMDKYQAYHAIRKPHFDGMELEASQCIILLEEFDIAIENLVAPIVKKIDMFVKKVEIDEEEKSFGPCTCETLVDEDEDVVCRSCFLRDDMKERKKKAEERESREGKKFTIEDLLELLQGPVPSERSLVFATTNKFEEIKVRCPALFRPGRLTPVHFNHLNMEAFDDLCRYHFGKTFEKRPERIIHCTASLIGMVMKAKTMFDDNDRAFEYFQEMFSQ